MSRADGAYTNQHFVPQFLLREWHSAPDSMLSAFQSIGGVLLHKRATARTVGFQRHLYSSTNSAGEHDTTLEREFMGPMVDQPAAIAHRQILEGGVTSLDPEQRGYWAQFLISLMLRTPDMIAMVRERARETFNRILDDDPDFMREQYPDMTSREVVEKHVPWVYSELAMGALPMLIQSDLLLAGVTKGQWATRTLSARCRFDLVIADRPLIYHGTMETSFLMVVPLSPRTLFAASNNVMTWRNLSRLTDDVLARKLNLDSVTGAARYVFASDDRHSPFIGKHLRSHGSAHRPRG